MRSHKAFLAKVVWAALAMGNLPDGVRVCIGIDNKKMAAMQPGLDATQFAEWPSFDAVTGAFREYADPPLQFSVWPMSLSSGVQVVVIDVEDFSRIPHFCGPAVGRRLHPDFPPPRLLGPGLSGPWTRTISATSSCTA